MAKSLELGKFLESHPYPDRCGITSLFRFYRIDLDRNGHLFTKRKLYHPLPSQMNDPFECKPHFSWPEDTDKVRSIRQHLIKVFRERGRNEKEAEALVSKKIKDPEFFQTAILNGAQIAYAGLRICSFTTEKDNLLFWSHYADSHKGFSVEFDATKMPMAEAYKVQYKNKYPEAIYPLPNDATVFTPALVKSVIWEYEVEFRTIFNPEAEIQPDNDGESLILKGDEIKNVYFGSCIDKNNKKRVLDLIKKGSFNPGIWTTSLSESTFNLDFTQVG